MKSFILGSFMIGAALCGADISDYSNGITPASISSYNLYAAKNNDSNANNPSVFQGVLNNFDTFNDGVNNGQKKYKDFQNNNPTSFINPSTGFSGYKNEEKSDDSSDQFDVLYVKPPNGPEVEIINGKDFDGSIITEYIINRNHYNKNGLSPNQVSAFANTEGWDGPKNYQFGRSTANSVAAAANNNENVVSFTRQAAIAENANNQDYSNGDNRASITSYNYGAAHNPAVFNGAFINPAYFNEAAYRHIPFNSAAYNGWNYDYFRRNNPAIFNDFSVYDNNGYNTRDSNVQLDVLYVKPPNGPGEEIITVEDINDVLPGGIVAEYIFGGNDFDNNGIIRNKDLNFITPRGDDDSKNYQFSEYTTNSGSDAANNNYDLVTSAKQADTVSFKNNQVTNDNNNNFDNAANFASNSLTTASANSDTGSNNVASITSSALRNNNGGDSNDADYSNGAANIIDTFNGDIATINSGTFDATNNLNAFNGVSNNPRKFIDINNKPKQNFDYFRQNNPITFDETTSGLVYQNNEGYNTAGSNSKLDILYVQPLNGPGIEIINVEDSKGVPGDIVTEYIIGGSYYDKNGITEKGTDLITPGGEDGTSNYQLIASTSNSVVDSANNKYDSVTSSKQGSTIAVVNNQVTNDNNNNFDNAADFTSTGSSLPAASTSNYSGISATSGSLSSITGNKIVDGYNGADNSNDVTTSSAKSYDHEAARNIGVINGASNYPRTFNDVANYLTNNGQKYNYFQHYDQAIYNSPSTRFSNYKNNGEYYTGSSNGQPEFIYVQAPKVPDVKFIHGGNFDGIPPGHIVSDNIIDRRAYDSNVVILNQDSDLTYSGGGDDSYIEPTSSSATVTSINSEASSNNKADTNSIGSYSGFDGSPGYLLNALKTAIFGTNSKAIADTISNFITIFTDYLQNGVDIDASSATFSNLSSNIVVFIINLTNLAIQFIIRWGYNLAIYFVDKNDESTYFNGIYTLGKYLAGWLATAGNVLATYANNWNGETALKDTLASSGAIDSSGAIALSGDNIVTWIESN